MMRLKRSLLMCGLLTGWAYGCDGSSEDSSERPTGGAGEDSAAHAGERPGGGEGGTAAEGGREASIDANAGAGAGAGGMGDQGGAATGPSANAGDAASGQPTANAGAPNSGEEEVDPDCYAAPLAGAEEAAAIDYVSPHVAYLGEQLGVIIRGANLPKDVTVCFGNRRAASVEFTSDTEIRAIPPLFKAAGRLTVTLGHATKLTYSHAQLVVRPHPNYPPFAVTTGVGFQERHVLYDAERDAVFSYCSWFGNHSAETPSTIHRYAYDQATGNWAMTSSYVPGLWDIALSPDGKHLLALGAGRLWLLDPVTFESLDFVELSTAGFGTAGQLGVANDGKVLIRDLGLAYSLVHKTFSVAKFPSAIGIVFSADGSRGVVGDANTSSDVPLSIYDASTGLITSSKAFEYFQLPSMDRTGSRYFSGGNLRNAELSLVGGVPATMAYMATDGKHAYEIDTATPSPTHIRVYALTGNGPTFPRLDDLVLPFTIDGFWLKASLDSRALFIPGPDKFIVAPLP